MLIVRLSLCPLCLRGGLSFLLAPNLTSNCGPNIFNNTPVSVSPKKSGREESGYEVCYVQDGLEYLAGCQSSTALETADRSQKTESALTTYPYTFWKRNTCVPPLTKSGIR